jgi:xanthine/uracil permease
VQNLAIGGIVLGFVVVAIIVAIAVLDRRGRIRNLQLLLGLGVGLVGAFLVLVLRVDLVPDSADDGIERLIVIAVTVAAVLGTWYRIARA